MLLFVKRTDSAGSVMIYSVFVLFLSSGNSSDGSAWQNDTLRIAFLFDWERLAFGEAAHPGRELLSMRFAGVAWDDKTLRGRSLVAKNLPLSCLVAGVVVATAFVMEPCDRLWEGEFWVNRMELLRNMLSELSSPDLFGTEILFFISAQWYALGDCFEFGEFILVGEEKTSLMRNSG